MGDYGDYPSVELDLVELPFELKAGTSLFPPLTDGTILDENQPASPPVGGRFGQTRIALELRSETSAAALTSFCKLHGLTLLSVLNVAWSLVLASYTGTDTVNVLFVQYVAGVPYVGLSETVIDGGRTVQETLTEAEQHLHTSTAVPSAISVSELQKQTAVDGHPAFNSVVLLSDSDAPEWDEVRATQCRDWAPQPT